MTATGHAPSSKLQPAPSYVSSIGEATIALKGEDCKASWSGKVGDDQMHLLLVADGHGGVDAAWHCASTVLDRVRKEAGDDPSAASLRSACHSAFVHAHKEVLAMSHLTAGCTLSIACINLTRNEVTTANVGDSAILLVQHASLNQTGGSGGGSSGEATPESVSTPTGGSTATTAPPAPPSPPQTLPPPVSAQSSISSNGNNSSRHGPLVNGHGGKEGSNGSRHNGSRYSGTFFARAFGSTGGGLGGLSSTGGSGGSGHGNGERDPEPIELSEDHRLERCHSEQQRISTLGGTIARAAGASGGPEGPMRVWPGGLAVARCVGDSDCKQFVSAEPSLRTVQIPTGGASIIVATDGVWDCLPFEAVGMILRRGVRRRPHSVKAQLVAEQIAAKAARAKGQIFDDTTLFVCHLIDPAYHTTSTDRSVHGGQSVHGSSDNGTPPDSFTRREASNNGTQSMKAFASWVYRLVSPPHSPRRAGPVRADLSSNGSISNGNASDEWASATPSAADRPVARTSRMQKKERQKRRSRSEPAMPRASRFPSLLGVAPAKIKPTGSGSGAAARPPTKAAAAVEAQPDEETAVEEFDLN